MDVSPESAENRCPQCQSPIPKDFWGGVVCPRCLFNPDIGSSYDTDSFRVRFSEGIRRFAHYELIKSIGRGGMGVVYEAIDLSTNQHVALKMIIESQLASFEARRRFVIEARAVARLKKFPNIVPLFEAGEYEDQPYLSMKFMEGGDLRKKIDSGKCCVPADKQSTPEQVRERQIAIVHIIITIARAAHHAHENSILHRDLTPANILFDTQGEPYLSDFGLAKILNKPPEDGVPTLTMSDIVMGVPSYMSPEQAACKPLTVASDVYSLGAIFYQMLTGQRPFKAENHILTLDLVQKQPPTRLRVFNPRIDIGLEAICLRCLEKNPEARYISALVLAEDLQRWLEGKRPLAQRSPVVALVTRTKQWMQSNPLGTALIASLCACLALALFVGKMLYDERQRADIARSFLRLKFETDNQQLWEDPNRFFLDFHPAEWATLSREFTPRVPTPDTIPLTFAFNTPENPTDRAERFAPFLRALEDKMELLLGHPVAITLRLYKPDVPQLLADVCQGRSDLISISPLAYIRAKPSAPGLEPVASPICEKWAIIFSRRNSGITNLSQVVGTRVGFAHTNTMISFYAKVYLARAGITGSNVAFYQNLGFPGNYGWTDTDPVTTVLGGKSPELYAHREVIKRVLTDYFDVGEAQERHFNRNRSRGLQELCRFKVEQDIYVARPGLAFAVRTALAKALASLTDLRLLGPMYEVPVTGFQPVNDADFKHLRSFMTNEVARFECVPPRPNDPETNAPPVFVRGKKSSDTNAASADSNVIAAPYLIRQ